MKNTILTISISLLLIGCNNSVSVEPKPQGLTLDFTLYESSINAIFDADLNGKTCSASGCHNVNGGAGGAFKIFPNADVGSTQMLANFFSVKSFTNIDDPGQSKLLLEPLAGTFSITGSHTGGDIFSDMADINYQTILTWISSPITQ